MIDHDRVVDAVRAVEDPEIPVALSDLGVVRSVDVDPEGVRVVLRPTRLGCPARDRMERDVTLAVRTVAPDVSVSVDWEMEVWSDADVSEAGRAALGEVGYAVLLGGPPRCPYCGSADTRREGAFGGALCKVPHTCRGCGSTFDALRSAAGARSR